MAPGSFFRVTGGQREAGTAKRANFFHDFLSSVFPCSDIAFQQPCQEREHEVPSIIFTWAFLHFFLFPSGVISIEFKIQGTDLLLYFICIHSAFMPRAQIQYKTPEWINEWIKFPIYKDRARKTPHRENRKYIPYRKCVWTRLCIKRKILQVPSRERNLKKAWSQEAGITGKGFRGTLKHE